jgi:hypothetical protein
VGVASEQDEAPRPLHTTRGAANLKAQADVDHHKGRTGNLYAIEFSSGTVKVGQSTAVARRVAAHIAAAAAHGLTADCIWISEPVDRLDERERDLLAFCSTRWSLAAGDEYFQRADIAQIVQQANLAGAATRSVQGRTLPAPWVGTSWGRTFRAHPAEAAEVRAWTRRRAHHPDAPQVANELFAAVLQAGGDTISMLLSTADTRLQITAVGSAPLPVLQTHGPGRRLIDGLSHTSGVTTDEQGLWAQLGTPP